MTIDITVIRDRLNNAIVGIKGEVISVLLPGKNDIWFRLDTGLLTHKDNLAEMFDSVIRPGDKAEFSDDGQTWELSVFDRCYLGNLYTFETKNTSYKLIRKAVPKSELLRAQIAELQARLEKLGEGEAS